MKPVRLETLEDLVRPAVEGQGYEFVDLEWQREHGHWILRVTIDRKSGQGFVSHQDCVNVSREVSVLLDLQAETLPGDYHLEVSSPGPERPLRTKEDFARFMGHAAKIRLKEHAAKPSLEATVGAANPRRNFAGVIESVDNDLVTLRLKDSDTAVHLSLKDVEKAHLQDE